MREFLLRWALPWFGRPSTGPVLGLEAVGAEFGYWDCGVGTARASAATYAMVCRHTACSELVLGRCIHAPRLDRRVANRESARIGRRGRPAHVVNVGHQYSAQVNFIQTPLYNGSGTKIGDVSGLAPWANSGAVAVGPGQDVYFTEGGSTMGQAFSSCRVDDVSSNVGP
jgi:hypothetical protein